MTTTLTDPPLTAAEVMAILADARTWPRCPECGDIHLEPFVDVNPDRIARIGPRAQDRLEQYLSRQDTTVLPNTHIRIACETPAIAKHTAALLRGLGAPAWAIHVGGAK